jgi:hypothetical protein
LFVSVSVLIGLSTATGEASQNVVQLISPIASDVAAMRSSCALRWLDAGRRRPVWTVFVLPAWDVRTFWFWPSHRFYLANDPGLLPLLIAFADLCWRFRAAFPSTLNCFRLRQGLSRRFSQCNARSAAVLAAHELCFAFVGVAALSVRWFLGALGFRPVTAGALFFSFRAGHWIS